MRELCTQFERATGNKIELRFEVNADASEKIDAGESFDVDVVESADHRAPLIKDSMVVGPRRADFGRAGLGVAVRRGHRKPDIVGRGLQAHIACSEGRGYAGKGASGCCICPACSSHGDQGGDAGLNKPMEAEDTVEVVARGGGGSGGRCRDAHLTFWRRGVGPAFRRELQTKIGFAAGLARPQEPDAAKALIRFLSAPRRRARHESQGVDPI